MTQRYRRLAACLMIGGLLAGCTETNPRLEYLVGDTDLRYYKDRATRIDEPHLHLPHAGEVLSTEEPRTLFDRRKDEVWDITLVEALHTALANNKVILSNVQIGSPANPLLATPMGVSAVHDPAIQDTGVLFGQRGVESALAAFDAQFTTALIFGHDERVQNNIFFGGGLQPGSVLVEETGVFNSGLSKVFAHGGQLTVAHDWMYARRNVPFQLFNSAYMGDLRTEYRHPLWAGAGTEFTRIAGPVVQFFGGLTGVNQGVAIARINHDISLADFETSVRNQLRDVEEVYWELYLRYRIYDTAVTARNAALQTWREAQARLEVGGALNFRPADEAQARDRYFQTRADTERTLNDLYMAEVNLRRMLGLPVNDGRILRPVDEPTPAQFVPDWQLSLTEALARRVELRRQKWNIKSLELQLRAAQKLVAPRLDFVSAYRVNAFGDELFGRERDGVTDDGFGSAYRTLKRGDQTGWNLGFEMTVPIGLRDARSQVRNIELRLARELEVLAAQEREISHELAVAFQTLAAAYATAESNFNRMEAARRSMELFQFELEAGTVTLDLVVRAQASLADAEQAYYTSLVDYNRAIMQFHYASGSLLDFNNVYLAEREWTPRAYDEALRRAWHRSFAFDKPTLESAPEAFAVPAYAREVRMPVPLAQPGDEPFAEPLGPEPPPSPNPPAAPQEDD